jgi:hypothetical protein
MGVVLKETGRVFVAGSQLTAPLRGRSRELRALAARDSLELRKGLGI